MRAAGFAPRLAVPVSNGSFHWLDRPPSLGSGVPKKPVKPWLGFHWQQQCRLGENGQYRVLFSRTIFLKKWRFLMIAVT
jgi:hypothetical protein